MKNRIGIVGGGQLGRMLAMSAKQLGFHVTVIDPTPGSPAGQVADAQIVADFKDKEAIAKLAQNVDFLTFEIELADSKILEELEHATTVNPKGLTLSLIRDKLLQKEFLRKNDIATARFRSVETEQDIIDAATEYGFPLVLKARLDAYDGRGNAVIRSKDEIPRALKKLMERSLYVEQFVPFEKELSVIIAKDINGTIRSYPIAETLHERNICQTVIVPAQIQASLAENASKLAIQVVAHLQGAGVFGIEMFLEKDGNILINEIAPRVHNTGHYTIEACLISQFEQHIRAVTGLPLGETSMLVPAAVMVNILGERDGKVDLKGLEKALANAGVAVHIYGKMDTRIDRKMGHITAIGETAQKVLQKAQESRAHIQI